MGHAVTAIEDPLLLDYLAEKEIGIESNLTSNVQTTTVPSYAEHPIKQFLQHGIKATINTDDPGISAIYIANEYETAAEKAGLDKEEIYQTQKNALQCAFLPESLKEQLLDKYSKLTYSN